MPAGQQISHDAASPANGHASVRDLFALTDEQILEIEPEPAEAPPVEQPLLAVPERRPEAASTKSATDPNSTATSPRSVENTQQSAQARAPVPQEPPPWLAAQMKDPWSGEEARELWNGVQQARQEAAAYRAAFATPEDARTLKELYPGGVNEARAAAESARVLDDIDRAYFGAAGKSPQEVSASRAQLAQQMLGEDPAAFREMVFAGLRALEAAGNQAGAASVGARFSTSPSASAASVGATLGSPVADGGKVAPGGAGPAPTAPSVGAQHAAPQLSSTSTHEARVAAYIAFEKAANNDLERSVGGAIERTLAQAVPNASRVSNASSVGAQHPDREGTGAAPLQARLNAAIREDVEAALKGDRQLSEQVAQILSGRRLDDETRIQVVRLIGERAQQLVPVAAKRVLNDWTQTTLAAHRGNTARADGVSTRREVTPASSDSGRTSVAANSPRTSQTRGTDGSHGASWPDSRRVDYRKLSDEQILDL